MIQAAVDAPPTPRPMPVRFAPDRRTAFALLYTAVVLSTMEYWLIPSRSHLTGLPGLLPGPRDLAAGLVWVASTLLLFLVLPALFVRFAHREALSSIGWDPRGFLRHLPIYLLLYALTLPLVLYASRRPDFLALYPFVPSARTGTTVLVVWEIAYALQFVALEAFFRGYLLFTCERLMGATAVFVMVVPYTMIHFHKPFPECLGAVVAGTVLGVLALRYRSFWGGALVHLLVALTMDLLAVLHAGRP